MLSAQKYVGQKNSLLSNENQSLVMTITYKQWFCILKKKIVNLSEFPLST